MLTSNYYNCLNYVDISAMHALKLDGIWAITRRYYYGTRTTSSTPSVTSFTFDWFFQFYPPATKNRGAMRRTNPDSLRSCLCFRVFSWILLPIFLIRCLLDCAMPPRPFWLCLLVKKNKIIVIVPGHWNMPDSFHDSVAYGQGQIKGIGWGVYIFPPAIIKHVHNV